MGLSNQFDQRFVLVLHLERLPQGSPQNTVRFLETSVQ